MVEVNVFKFINGGYTIDADIFFEYDKCNRRGHSKNCTKDELDLIFESLCLEIRLRTSGIIYHNVTLIAQLSNFKSHIHKVLEPETK